MATLRDNPGASVNALAKAAGANPSSTGERLGGLASRGVSRRTAPVTGGLWRNLRRGRGPNAAAVELTEGPEPELLDPRPADAHAPWLKLDSYDRRERCEFQVSRYG
jgi:hypothetical protein